MWTACGKTREGGGQGHLRLSSGFHMHMHAYVHLCVHTHTHTRAHKKKGKKEGRGKTEYMERREGKTKGRDEKRSVLCRPVCLSVI